MHISVHMTEEDYIKFNEHSFWNSSIGKKQYRMVKYGVPILAFAVLFILWFGFDADDLTAIIIAVIFAVYTVFRNLRLKKYFEKNIRKSVMYSKKDGKLPYSEYSELEFGDEYIVETDETTVKKVRYSDLVSVGYTEEHIFVYNGAYTAFVIPRRCMADNGAALTALLEEKTGK